MNEKAREGKVTEEVYKCMYCGTKFKEVDIPTGIGDCVKYAMLTRPMCLSCYPKVDY